MKHNFLEPTRKPKVIYIDIPRIRHKSVKLTMELLKRKRRHLTVQKDLGLLNSGMLNRGEVPFITVAVDQSTVKLVEATKTHRSQLNEIAENSGTLNRGRNLCVTVAIDHLTVDGFHDELQLSAKNTKGKALRRISWVKGFHLVRWNDYHSISACNRLKFHQFGSTVLHESLLEYVWYAGGEVWKWTLMQADLEQVDNNRRVRIPQHKAQREGDDLAQIGDNSQKPQMDT